MPGQVPVIMQEGKMNEKFRFNRQKLSILVITFAAILIMELVFRLATLGFETNGYMKQEIIIITATCLMTSSALYAIRMLIPGKVGAIAHGVLVIVIDILFAAQIVYFKIFGTFFTVYSMFHGGEAFQFTDVIWDAMKRGFIPLIIIFAIGIVMIYLLQKINQCMLENKLAHAQYSSQYGEGSDFEYQYSDNYSYGGSRSSRHRNDDDSYQRMYTEKKKKLIEILIVVFVFLSGALFNIAIVSREDTNPQSPYQYICCAGEIEGCVRCYGLTGGMLVDGYRLIFGFTPKTNVDDPTVVVSRTDNVIPGLNFTALANKEENSTIKKMHQYFATVIPTKKNAYTGLFEGKNLIFITGESFSDLCVDEKHTPTLYKLMHEGYYFTNFYNPVWGVSTLDGEYVNLQGLAPKPGVWSMSVSGKNYLPFTLGNQFPKLGYNIKAFHDHSIFYYDRNESFPALGYDLDGQYGSYSFKETWPESDVEMIDKTAHEFLTPNEDGTIDPFHVYYLSVSGHLNYNFFGNVMCAKHEDDVKDMDLSEPCRAYIACNMEFDQAVELLIKKLDAAGVLENTVIAIAGDHYPYGLADDKNSELRGYNVEGSNELYRSGFILWTPNMEPTEVNKVCCNMDILPTLSNLFGIEYDSRLLMGRDIFSAQEGFVVFKDKTWISDRGKREALVGKDDSYVASMDKRASNILNYSAMILDNNYYAHLGLKKSN